MSPFWLLSCADYLNFCRGFGIRSRSLIVPHCVCTIYIMQFGSRHLCNLTHPQKLSVSIDFIKMFTLITYLAFDDKDWYLPPGNSLVLFNNNNNNVYLIKRPY